MYPVSMAKAMSPTRNTSITQTRGTTFPGRRPGRPRGRIMGRLTQRAAKAGGRAAGSGRRTSAGIPTSLAHRRPVVPNFLKVHGMPEIQAGADDPADKGPAGLYRYNAGSP